MTCSESTGYRLACSEVWGGNCRVAALLELPGLRAWVCATPLEPASCGGDVLYLSVCDKGILSRIALADVSGHGQMASSLAESLRALMHRHMNSPDQRAFVSELNNAFQRFDRRATGSSYATAAVLGFCRDSGQLIFTNAGHVLPLWYRANERSWNWLLEKQSHTSAGMTGLPLGLLPGIQYQQQAMQLGPGDLVLLYTDGLAEAVSEDGQELGRDRLLEFAAVAPVDSPVAAGQALLARVREFRGGVLPGDDETLVVLQRE